MADKAGLCICLITCLAGLYDGAFMLLITGRIGMPVLCNFIFVLVLVVRVSFGLDILSFVCL